MKTKAINIQNYRIDSHALACRITARINRIIESETIKTNLNYASKKRINTLRTLKVSLLK